MKFKQYKPCWWNCSLGIMALASPGVLLEKKNLGPIWDPQNQNLHFKQILRGFLYMLHLRRSALHPWAHLMDRKEAFFFWTFFKKSHVMTMKETEISVWFSYSVVFDSLWPHESQHARPPCPSPTPGVHSDSCPLSRWCHSAISSSVIPFSSCPQSLPASQSFPMSQLFAWGGQSTGASALASFLPMNTQDWSPLEWTGWISLQSKGHHFV